MICKAASVQLPFFHLKTTIFSENSPRVVMESLVKRSSRLSRPSQPTLNNQTTSLRSKRRPSIVASPLHFKRGRVSTEDRPSSYQRTLPPGGYGLHDGGVVASITDIPEDADWLIVKRVLTETLNIGDDAVVYASHVHPETRECFALLKPFTDDLSICRGLARISAGTVRVVDGLELAAAIRTFPAHIQRLRETRATACAKARRG